MRRLCAPPLERPDPAVKSGTIRRIRRGAGLSVSQLACALNLTDPDGNGADRVREMERDRRDVSGPVERLMQLIDDGLVPIDDLLAGRWPR